MRQATMRLKASLTPALSHPMGEGESFAVSSNFECRRFPKRPLARTGAPGCCSLYHRMGEVRVRFPRNQTSRVELLNRRRSSADISVCGFWRLSSRQSARRQSPVRLQRHGTRMSREPADRNVRATRFMGTLLLRLNLPAKACEIKN